MSAADPLVLVGGYDPAIRAFTLDGAGVLHPLAVSPVGHGPSFLAVAADQHFVYACDEPAGRVIACALDRASGALRPLGSVSSGGKTPCHVALDPSGRWLFCANYGDGRVAALPVRADGGLDEPASVVEAGAQAHMALPSADGPLVYVPCKGADRVAVFNFAEGRLSLVSSAGTPAGAGPRHLAFAADQHRAWLVEELASLVQPATVAADGGLTLGGSVPTLPPGWSGTNTAGGILLADAGRLLLTSNRGHDSIALFSLDADSIPHPAGHAAVGRTPRHLALSPDGRFVLAACQGADRVEVLRLEGGRLSPIGSVAVPKPAFVGVYP